MGCHVFDGRAGSFIVFCLMRMASISGANSMLVPGSVNSVLTKSIRAAMFITVSISSNVEITGRGAVNED